MVLRSAAVIAALIAGLMATAEEQIRLRDGLQAHPVAEENPELAALPLLTRNTIETMLENPDGGFCPPDGSSGGYTLNYAPTAMGMGQTTSRLYMQGGGPDSYVTAEVSIPALVDTDNPAVMNEATYAQTSVSDLSESLYDDATYGPSGSTDPEYVAASFFVHNGYLYSGFYKGYDSGSLVRPFMRRPLTLTETGSVVGFTGFTGLADAAALYTHRMQAAALSLIPEEWQEALGGWTHAGGRGTTGSIVSSQSLGPALFGINLSNVGFSGNAQPFVFYDNSHRTLGEFNGVEFWLPDGPGAYQVGDGFESGTLVSGTVLINGTRTVMFLGVMGHSDTECYGIGLGDPNDPLIGTQVPGYPHYYCYDPASAASGQHTAPNYYTAWLYNVEDMVDVVNGVSNAWEIEPYEIFTFQFPTTTGGIVQISSVAYEPTTRKLYVAQRGDTGGCANSQSIVWGYTVPSSQ